MLSCFRKRSREDDQDGEFFPLSKRINNLHLSANHYNAIAQQNYIQHQQGPEVVLYNPELKAHENPHYFSSNKVLYDLHIERNQRIGRLG